MLERIHKLSPCLDRDQKDPWVQILFETFLLHNSLVVETIKNVRFFFPSGSGNFKTFSQIKSEQLGMGEKVGKFVASNILLSALECVRLLHLLLYAQA